MYAFLFSEFSASFHISRLYGGTFYIYILYRKCILCRPTKLVLILVFAVQCVFIDAIAHLPLTWKTWRCWSSPKYFMSFHSIRMCHTIIKSNLKYAGSKYWLIWMVISLKNATKFTKLGIMHWSDVLYIGGRKLSQLLELIFLKVLSLKI